MSTKKQVTNADIVFDNTKIILRSVYDKANIKYFIQPCKDKQGNFPACIKRVNSQGDMIMSEKERGDWSEGKVIFFPETKIFEITSGKVYDLTKMQDKAEWDAIKNCPLIAKSRDEKDANGNYVIDGPIQNVQKAYKNGGVGNTYGVAELYVYRPGLDTQRKITRKQLIHKACSYIYDDERGADGQRNRARLLGKNMNNQPIADVLDFLVSYAEKDPQKIINLYTGDDITLRLLFIDAKEKNVIHIKNKVYMYGDSVALGVTDDAAIAWMKEPRNFKVLELIKKDTYPEYFSDED